MSFTAYDVSTVYEEGIIDPVQAEGVDEHGRLLVPVEGRGKRKRYVQAGNWFRTQEEAWQRMHERLEAAIVQKQKELNAIIELRNKLHFRSDPINE